MSPPLLLAPLLATVVAPRAPPPRCSGAGHRRGADAQSDLPAASAPAPHSPASTPSSTSPPGRALFVAGQQQEGLRHSARAAARQPKRIPIPSHVRARPRRAMPTAYDGDSELRERMETKRFLC